MRWINTIQLLLPPIDITDLSILLAMGAIILLATAQLSPSYFGSTDLATDTGRLRNAAIVSGILFLVTVVIRIIGLTAGA